MKESPLSVIPLLGSLGFLHNGNTNEPEAAGSDSPRCTQHHNQKDHGQGEDAAQEEDGVILSWEGDHPTSLHLSSA